MPVVVPVQRVCHYVEAQARTLLRVVLLRLSTVSAGATQWACCLFCCVMRGALCLLCSSNPASPPYCSFLPF
jgi:hypothetical protein